jgi:predicted permease
MPVLPRVRSWWRSVVHRSAVERGMSDEVEFHIARHAERLADIHGLSHGEALRRAHVEFGSVERYKEEARRSLGLALVDDLRRDVRYAWRMAAKQKGLTATVVAILAITIGANSAVYTLVDRLVVRPLPYPEPQRLGAIVRHFERGGRSGESFSVTGSVWETMRDGVPDLDIAVVGGPSGVNLAAGEDIAYVQQQRVSSGYFRVLGMPPAIGREFTADEDRSGGPSAVILSHSLWTRTFHADPTIVGHAITLRGEPSIVVGVLPDGFQPTIPVDIWTPLRPSTQGEGAGSNYELVARVRPAAAWTAVAHRVEAIGDVLIRERVHPPADVHLSLRLVPWQRVATNTIRQPLLVLWAAVLVVLLIGCVNIAGLLLSRSSARAREIATRIAIGGGRGAIARQLLVESLLLAAGGSVAGIGLGYVLSRSLAAQFATVIALPTNPDLRVFFITTGASLATSVAFGLFPALHATRADVRRVLGDAGGGTIAGRGNRWPTQLMVVSQIALGIVLVMAAGLLIRTFSHLTRQPSNVDPSNVVAATMSLQDARYRTPDAVNALFDRSLNRIRQLPGVADAAIALSLPYERALNNGWRFDGEPMVQQQTITLTYVTPDYFRTLKTPVRAGRVFDDGDRQSSRKVVVVNDAFVRHFGQGRGVVGRLIHLGGAAQPAVEIVGVVGAIQQSNNVLQGGGPVAAIPGAFVPATQFGDAFLLAHNWFQPSWIVRTRGPVPIVAALRQTLREIDPQLTFNKFRTIDDVQSEIMTTPRTLTWLLAMLAGIAIVLCVVGVYGLVASTVAERRRELGVRIALGATPYDTLKAAALGGIGLAIVGTAAGALLSVPAMSVMRQIVFGVSVNDPLTLAAAAAIVVLAAAAAAMVPAWRTLRMNVTAVLNST